MAIAKTTLLTALNADLLRSETNIDTYIMRALFDLSGRALWKDLHTSDTATIAQGETSFAVPSDIRVLDEITLNDGTHEGEPLTVAAWREILAQREGQQSQGEPTQYRYRGRSIQFHPQADAAYTATTWYWKWCLDPDDIDFGDTFLTALIYATQAFYLTGKGLRADPKFAEVWANYGNALSDLSGEVDQQSRQVVYRNI